VAEVAEAVRIRAASPAKSLKIFTKSFDRTEGEPLPALIYHLSSVKTMDLQIVAAN